MRVGRQVVAASGGRWIALDLLRFCAVLLMVQGHTFTELLDPAVRAERWYRHHGFVHGYTAPMFLFASGLAFGYTTFRAWEANTRVGDALWRRLRRYGLLIGIGYLLHLPAASLEQLLRLDAQQVQSWLQVDVLQHVGVSLAICQLLALALRRPERFAWATGALLVASVALAPLVWRWDGEAALPGWLAGYLDDSGGSLFPLVPWAGFTHAGILCAYAARHARAPAREMAWPLAVVAALVLIVPIAINHTGFNPYGPHDFWRTSPYYFCWRLGNVLAVLALLCFLERGIERARLLARTGSATGRVLGALRLVGQESLVVYVAHLLVLHGSVIHYGIVQYTGATLSLLEASGVALSLMLAMGALAHAWAGLRDRELRFRALQVATTAAILLALVATST